MMFRVAFFAACILAASAAPHSSTPAEKQAELMLEFKDFIAVLPMQRMYNTLVDHLNNDPEMQAAIHHVQSKEFQQITAALTAKAVVKELKTKYRNAGLDVDRYEQMMNNIIAGLELSDVPEDTERSFGKFLVDIEKLIPYEKLLLVLHKKLEKSPVFIQFFNEISDEVMHTLFDKMMLSVEFKHVAQELEDMDVPVYQILDVVYNIFGWNGKQPAANNL